jgi:hypothetical protein
MNKNTFIGSLKRDRSVILMILAPVTENSLIFILVFCAANSAFEI